MTRSKFAKGWVHAVFTILVLSLILACLRWIDFVDRPHEAKVVVAPIQSVPSKPPSPPAPTFSSTGLLEKPVDLKAPPEEPEAPQAGVIEIGK